MSNITKALIIEDNDEVVDAVYLAFKIRWPQAVTISTDRGKEGIDLVSKENPDFVILDLGLPDINGFEVLKQIRLFSDIPIIILTVRGEEADIVKGLELGADEYIIKPFRQLELMARVKAVTRRCFIKEEEPSVSCGQLTFNPSERTIYYGTKTIKLTSTESIILLDLMKKAGRVVTKASLAESLWGTNYPDASSALKVYISRLRSKIEPDQSSPRFIVTSPGLGYIFSKE